MLHPASRPGFYHRAVTITAIAHTTLYALVFLCAVALATSALLAVRALGAWRTFRAFNRSVNDAVAAVTGAVADSEARAADLTRRVEELTAATARLQGSLERLDVLRSAAAEVGKTVAAARGAVPRK